DPNAQQLAVVSLDAGDTRRERARETSTSFGTSDAGADAGARGAWSRNRSPDENGQESERGGESLSDGVQVANGRDSSARALSSHLATLTPFTISHRQSPTSATLPVRGHVTTGGRCYGFLGPNCGVGSGRVPDWALPRGR